MMDSCILVKYTMSKKGSFWAESIPGKDMSTLWPGSAAADSVSAGSLPKG